MAKFEKGNPGKRPGTLNKFKKIKLEEGLAQNGVKLTEHLAMAIVAKDVEMIRALAAVLPYLAPKQAVAAPETGEVVANISPSTMDDETLLKLVSDGKAD